MLYVHGSLIKMEHPRVAVFCRKLLAYQPRDDLQLADIAFLSVVYDVIQQLIRLVPGKRGVNPFPLGGMEIWDELLKIDGTLKTLSSASKVISLLMKNIGDLPVLLTNDLLSLADESEACVKMGSEDHSGPKKHEKKEAEERWKKVSEKRLERVYRLLALLSPNGKLKHWDNHDIGMAGPDEDPQPFYPGCFFAETPGSKWMEKNPFHFDPRRQFGEPRELDELRLAAEGLRQPYEIAEKLIADYRCDAPDSRNGKDK
ncbi:hypothetical protein F5Y15DRAFT_395818 [Xylariaceae sp. FL0016]|nr:hypothetical protein F5Y15DRAFT_395818 [Xylariaceae sp. FL0016]